MSSSVDHSCLVFELHTEEMTAVERQQIERERQLVERERQQVERERVQVAREKARARASHVQRIAKQFLR